MGQLFHRRLWSLYFLVVAFIPKRSFYKSFLLFIYLWEVGVMCHGTHVEVRGQLARMRFSSTMGAKGLNSGLQTW